MLSRRKVYATARWKRVRLAVIDRDGRRCTECGGAGRLEVHHVRPIQAGGAPFDLDNLRTVCRRCHFGAEPARTPRVAWARRLDYGDAR